MTTPRDQFAGGLRVEFRVSGFEATPAIREYLEKKLTALDRFVDAQDTSAYADVEIAQTTRHHQSGRIFRAEINLFVGGKQLYASAERDDLYAAIDAVKDDAVYTLKQRKGRRTALFRKGAKRAKDLLRGFRRGT